MRSIRIPIIYFKHLSISGECFFYWVGVFGSCPVGGGWMIELNKRRVLIMADNKSSEEKHIASSKALFVRRKILEHCKEDCFDLTPKQVDTVLELAKEYVPKKTGTLDGMKEGFSEYGKALSKIRLNIDCSDALKGLKAVQREARKASAAMKELEEQQKKDKYFVVELDEFGDIPRVFYKGKEITKKEFINFQWQTKTEKPGHTDIIVDYFDVSDSKLISKSIREGTNI